MVRYLRPRPLRARPRVSVVIPCYKYGHYLPVAVGGALAQPGVDVEVLIVDDASPDGSADVARRLAAEDPRVRVIAHERNAGHIATFNEGLAAVDGDYVVLLSADDLLAPGSLSRAVALMERHRDVAFTYGFAPTFTDEPPAPRTVVRRWSVWTGEEWFARLCTRGNNVVLNPEVVMRGSVMRELVGYDPRLPHAGDLHLWLRAALRGNVGRINGAHQAYYRVHGDNMHLGYASLLLTDLRERRATFEHVLAEDAAGLPRRDRYAARARRAIAIDALRLASHAHDAGGVLDGGSPRDFAAFAQETWPDVVRTHLWRAVERRARTGVPGWRRQAAHGAREVRGILRWRRWRRFGT